MLQKTAFGILLSFFSFLTQANALLPPSSVAQYPCDNGNILTYFKRPAVATSACPMPYGKISLESGIQYNEFLNRGEQWAFPQIKTRIGLPWRSELSVLFPSEKINSRLDISGLGSAVLALKHEITYSGPWNIAARAIYIPASGGSHFGTANDGYVFNGILVYKTQKINITAMAGVSSLSTPKANGGARFNTFSPDLLIGWFLKDWFQVYTEVYGQTRAAPHQGPGYNLNSGLLFLLKKYIALDLEISNRLSGQLGNFNTYYGGGISFMFSP